MADAPDLGSGSERIGGSSPLARTIGELLYNPFERVEADLEVLHFGTETDAAIIGVAALAAAVSGVHVKEDARDDDDFFLQPFAEETHPVIQRLRQVRQIRPYVKSPLWLGLHANSTCRS